MSKYKISFWNYERTGVWDEAQAVRDWKEAGINLAMTFEFNPEREDKARMLRLLDECQKEGLQAIVCDERTTFYALRELGEEKFREGVQAAVADFGSHPAVYGFHVGDEPDADAWEYAKKAFAIVRAAQPALKPFINMNPTWLTPDFKDAMGTDLEGYKQKLIDFTRETGSEIVSFDCYTQCMYNDVDFNRGEFVRNLRFFADVAKATGTELFVSVLSAGHWNYRVPTEDDIRWQINMSVAHGATGIFWFLFYQRFLDENYRGMPITMFGKRTQTYETLAYENSLFMKYFSEKLQHCKVEDISYYHKPYGGYPLFSGEYELKSIDAIVNPSSVCVTRWRSDEGKICYTFVNVETDRPTRIKVVFEGALEAQSRTIWLAPGQLIYIDEKDMIPLVSYSA